MRKTNDLLFLLSAFIFLIPVLLSSNAALSLASLILSFINLLIWRRINIKHLLLLIAVLIIPLLSVFITVLLYTKGADTSPIISYFLGFPIYKLALDTAILLTVRSFCLTVISFIFLLAINSDALVFSLMQNLKLPVSIGYALLSTFNAFIYMKEEFSRIRLAYRMRFQKQIFPLKLLIPILVSASRYAHYAGLSLESKGLHNKKTYTEIHKWTKLDWLILVVNIFQVVILIYLFEVFSETSIKFV